MSAPPAMLNLEITERHSPSSIDEAMRLVARARQENKAVLPIGGGVSLDEGPTLAKPAWGIETSALTRVDDYPSEDMTITVEAGLTIRELSQLLASKGQSLPIDVARPDRATIGGVIATNASGPRRFGFGTMRDYLLGIDFVRADGERVHGGGRVVKNVAGYDFMKLLTGSRGWLGLIVQVTLKLRPLPQARAAVIVDAEGKEESLLSSLNLGKTRPIAIEWLDAPLSATPSLQAFERPFVLLYEESKAAVDGQLHAIGDELTSLGVDRFQRVTDASAYDQLLERLTEWPASDGQSALLKATMVPSQLVSFVKSLSTHARPDAGVSWKAHAGSGVVWIRINGDREFATDLIRDARSRAEQGHGWVNLVSAPSAWRASYPWRSEPRPEGAIVERLKNKLDPTDLFSPGRMP